MTDHITEWLGAYLDGELQGARLRQIEAHLASCPVCRSELDELRSLSRLLAERDPLEDRLSAGRFAANLALRLPRRTEAQPQSPVWRLAWWAVPVTLLAAWLVFDITATMSSVFSLIVDSGVFGSGLNWLSGAPAQMDWFAAALSTFGSRIGAPGWTVLGLLNEINVFVAQLVRALLPQVLLAAAYLAWLAAWWYRRAGRPAQATR